MFTQFGQNRHGSRLVAWLSVLGLIIAMFAASIEPAAADASDENVSAVVVEVALVSTTAGAGDVASWLRRG